MIRYTAIRPSPVRHQYPPRARLVANRGGIPRLNDAQAAGWLRIQERKLHSCLRDPPQSERRLSEPKICEETREVHHAKTLTLVGVTSRKGPFTLGSSARYQAAPHYCNFQSPAGFSVWRE